MANLQVDSTECLPGPPRVFFSNDVNIKVTVDFLLDNFRNDNVVFFLFPSLSSYGGVSSKSIHYIPDFFLFEYCLDKVSLLRLVLKVAEFLSFTLTNVIFVNHLANLDDLEKGKNVILVPVHIPDLIT